MMNEALPEGVTYEVHQSHGGDYWVPVIHGRTAAETPEQAVELLEAVHKKRFTDAPLLRVVKVSREVVEVRDFSKPPSSPPEQHPTATEGRRAEWGWAVSGRTLEDVLRDHLFTLYPGQIVCDCEWTAEDDATSAGDGRMIAAHVAHVAAEVRAWLGELRRGAQAGAEAQCACAAHVDAAADCTCSCPLYTHVGDTSDDGWGAR